MFALDIAIAWPYGWRQWPLLLPLVLYFQSEYSQFSEMYFCCCYFFHKSIWSFFLAGFSFFFRRFRFFAVPSSFSARNGCFVDFSASKFSLDFKSSLLEMENFGDLFDRLHRFAFIGLPSMTICWHHIQFSDANALHTKHRCKPSVLCQTLN